MDSYSAECAYVCYLYVQRKKESGGGLSPFVCVCVQVDFPFCEKREKNARKIYCSQLLSCPI